MKKLLYSIGLTLVVLVSLLALSPGSAQAAASHNCNDDTVCLYQNIWYGAPAGDANPGWKSSFGNIRNQHCINLTQPAAYWPNGTQVWDNSAGLVVNGGGAYGQQDSIGFYNSLNCSTATGVAYFNANWTTNYGDLRTLAMGYGYYAYHTIASIGWYENCPPSGC